MYGRTARTGTQAGLPELSQRDIYANYLKKSNLLQNLLDLKLSCIYISADQNGLTVFILFFQMKRNVARERLGAAGKVHYFFSLTWLFYFAP